MRDSCCHRAEKELTQSVNMGSDPQKTHLPAPVLQDQTKLTIRKQKCVRWSSSCGPCSVSGHWLLASYFQFLFSQGTRWKDRWWQLGVSEPGDQLGCPSSFILLLMPWDVLCSSDKITTKKAEHQPERSPHRYGGKKTQQIRQNWIWGPFFSLCPQEPNSTGLCWRLTPAASFTFTMFLCSNPGSFWQPKQVPPEVSPGSFLWFLQSCQQEHENMPFLPLLS